MILKDGMVLFFGWFGKNDDEAREYIRESGFTDEDVKLVKRGEAICVVAIRDIEIEGE